MHHHQHIGLAAGKPRRQHARVPDPVPIGPPPRPRPGSQKCDRDRIEDLIERLIALLDAMDGDDDLDPTADDDWCRAEDAVLMGFGRTSGMDYPGNPDDAEEDDDLEASLQPAVTPDSARPTLGMAVWP